MERMIARRDDRHAQLRPDLDDWLPEPALRVTAPPPEPRRAQRAVGGRGGTSG